MVTVIFKRSDAMLEKLSLDGVESGDTPYSYPSSFNAGKFDWVQLTYAELRVSPDGEPLAHFDSALDAWYLNLSVDVGPWSDVVIKGSVVRQRDKHEIYAEPFKPGESNE